MGATRTDARQTEVESSEQLAGYAAIAGAVLVIVATAVFLLSPPGGRSPVAGIPSFWFVDPLYGIGALLFAASLLGLHERYGAEYGMPGRVLLALLGLVLVVYAITQTITMPVVGVEITGPAELIPALGTIGRFLLASLLGVLLYRTSAPRLQVGVLFLVFPVGLISSPLLLDSRVLLALSEVLFALAFVLIGWDLLSRTRNSHADSISE